MEPWERRNLLETTPAPVTGRDYAVTLRGSVNGYDVTIRYVPYRELVTPDALAVYLEMVGKLDLTGIEPVGVTIIEDFFDVSVARWTEVRLTGNDGKQKQDFLAEERQPGWKNDRLLERLG
jgi:hypothetical protein